MDGQTQFEMLLLRDLIFLFEIINPEYKINGTYSFGVSKLNASEKIVKEIIRRFEYISVR